MRPTDMKAHISRVAAVETMAVDAALKLRILNQRTLFERREIAFVDAHLAPHLVARLNQAVADAIIDAVRTDVDGEGAIGVPAIFILGRDGHAERVATVLPEQGMPVSKVEVC